MAWRKSGLFVSLSVSTPHLEAWRNRPDTSQSSPKSTKFAIIIIAVIIASMQSTGHDPDYGFDFCYSTLTHKSYLNLRLIPVTCLYRGCILLSFTTSDPNLKWPKSYTYDDDYWFYSRCCFVCRFCLSRVVVHLLPDVSSSQQSSWAVLAVPHPTMADPCCLKRRLGCGATGVAPEIRTTGTYRAR